ncbi:MAG: peptidylprolyl isomerase [Anaerolineales bacterium]
MIEWKTIPWALLILALLLGACAPPTPVPMDDLLTTEEEQPTVTEEVSGGETVPPTPPATPVPLAALVNGEPLTLQEYERQIARYEVAMLAAGEDPGTPEGQEALTQAREDVLEQLIEQQLILQAAAEAGVTVSDAEVEADIQATIDDIGEEALNAWLAEEGLTREELQEEWRAQMIISRMVDRVISEVPREAEQVHARHIVVSSEEEARQLLTQLQAGADFAALARAYSLDESTRERGGDLDYFPRGLLTAAEVEEAAFALQPGQVSDVIQSPIGYHIVQVVDRVPSMEVTDRNLQFLWNQAREQWLESLWNEAQIERFVEPGS